MNRILLALSTLALASISGGAVVAYDYPIDDALAATAIGTPREHVAKLPRHIKRKEMRVVIFPDREVKPFVPRKALNYTLAAQKRKAPLIFMIAGTGASHRSAKMLMMEKTIDPAQEIVAYCRGPHCVLAFDPVQRLRKRGLQARRLEDGYPEWKLAGLPVERSGV